MLAAIEEVKQNVIEQPRPIWKRLFEVIWPTREHRRTSQDALTELWNTAKSWASKAFAAVQKYFDSWNNELKPELEEQIAQVDEFLAQEETLTQAAQAQQAVASILKKYK